MTAEAVTSEGREECSGLGSAHKYEVGAETHSAKCRAGARNKEEGGGAGSRAGQGPGVEVCGYVFSFSLSGAGRRPPEDSALIL